MIRARAAALILALAAGCGHQAAPVSKTFILRGLVRKVDSASGEVTIAHRAIPGFMPAMIMPFTLKDRSALDDLRPGDEVEGPLRVDFAGTEVKDYDLIDLTVTRPAPETPSVPVPVPVLVAQPSALPGMAGATLGPGDAVPDFAVTTQDGKVLRLSDLKGQVVAFTFIYTRCPLPDFCPAMDAKFAILARRISAVRGRADRVRLVSISFDPEHDTPAVLTAHARLKGAEPPLWTFAVASREELDRIAGPLGLAAIPGDREISHNLRTAVVGPDGRLARLESGGGWTPADLLKTILPLIPAHSQ